MPDDDRWMDRLAEDRAARKVADRETTEEAERRAHEITTAIKHQLPGLKARLADAAIKQTDEFKHKLRLGSELTCVYDRDETIQVIWSKNLGVRLTIKVLPASLDLKVLVEHDESPGITLPPADLFIDHGILHVRINEESVTPEEAISRLLTPFFELIAEAPPNRRTP
jgi:hypothetical protein